MVLLLRKIYLYFTKDREAVQYLPGARHHKREPRSQDNLQIYYSSASTTVHSKGTEQR